MAEAETKRPSRNGPCHCGSGKKYKHCCLTKDEEANREAWAQQARTELPAPPHEPERAPRTTPPRRTADQPWKRTGQTTRSFQKISGPRKVGSS